jgi:hypothetical protein
LIAGLAIRLALNQPSCFIGLLCQGALGAMTMYTDMRIEVYDQGKSKFNADLTLLDGDGQVLRRKHVEMIAWTDLMGIARAFYLTGVAINKNRHLKAAGQLDDEQLPLFPE